ncbi:hypothetical protein HK104_004573 [Borealophlyctis nickersoniae]|nr:hypothetical protein HK104_004573 [Borealophlyctis nickersoniae]
MYIAVGEPRREQKKEMDQHEPPWYPFGKPEQRVDFKKSVRTDGPPETALAATEAAKSRLREEQERLIKMREEEQRRRREQELSKGRELASSYPWNWGADEVQRRQMAHRKATDVFGQHEHVNPETASRYSQALDRLVQERKEKREAEKQYDTKMGLQVKKRHLEVVLALALTFSLHSPLST